MTHTIKELQEELSYNAFTGEFFWLKPRKRRDVTKPAGWNKLGYLCIGIDQVEYYAHRLAWAFTYGEWPNEIDHINHKRADNRIENLRDVARVQNAQNQSMRSDNTSGYNGVTAQQGGWQVTIGDYYVGWSRDIKEAAKIRKAADIVHGYHQNHGRAK